MNPLIFPSKFLILSLFPPKYAYYPLYTIPVATLRLFPIFILKLLSIFAIFLDNITIDMSLLSLLEMNSNTPVESMNSTDYMTVWNFQMET
jgi:hypothetical protein